MTLAPGTLEAFGLVLLRTSALVISSPVIGMGTGFSGVKVALIVGLSIVVYGVAGAPLEGSVGPLAFGALAVRELLIGLFLGFVFQITLLAVRVAGELIGHEMGMFMARQADPESGVSSSLVSKVYENFAVLALLAVNGHHLLVRALRDSVRLAPVGDLPSGSGLAAMTQSMLGQMFGAGLAFAAPVMIFLMLVSILLGLLSRAVPQLNILELSFTMRIALALVTMYLFAPMLEPALDQLLASYGRWMDSALTVIAPDGGGR